MFGDQTFSRFNTFVASNLMKFKWEMFGDQTFSRFKTFVGSKLMKFKRRQPFKQKHEKTSLLIFDTAGPQNTASKCLVTKQYLMVFSRQTSPALTD